MEKVQNLNVKQLPKKICQYREECYRKNPVHFTEYSHPHLEKILAKGVHKTSKEYEVPDELFLSKEIVLSQLKVLESLFPQFKIQSDKDDQEHKKITVLKSESKSNDNIKLENENTLIGKPSSSKDQNKLIKPITSGLDNLNSDLNVKTIDSSKENKLSVSSSDKIRENLSSSKTIRRLSPTPCTSSKTYEVDEMPQAAKKQKININIHDYIPVVVPKGQMAKKLENAAPYNFFLTTIKDSPQTHNEPLSITFLEILDKSLGEIECSLQINFMVDIGWLLGYYYFAGCLDKPLLVLYGSDSDELKNISQTKPQVTAIKIQMTPFATHHSKVMLLGYKDGSMRVVVSTANLYEDDWVNRTQGVWISPKLDPLPENCDTTFGESPTEFRNDLLLYLVEYKISKLQPWITRIRKTDFRSINVFFVGSVPGGHRASSTRGHPWGHARVGSLLNEHSAKIDDSCPIVAQSSSIGSLGPNVQSWVISDFGSSFRKDSSPPGVRRLPAFKMIYPSYGNVKNSHDDLLGGGCLPYGKKTNDKQPWLKNHLHQWKAKNRYRSRGMPHIKSYCRWSDEGLYWFVLTSANLSKAAWGTFNKASKIEPVLRILNYEVGVVFLPKFVIGEDTFPIGEKRDGIPPFPIPYDIPLTPYAPDDVPFVMDYLREYYDDDDK